MEKKKFIHFVIDDIFINDSIRCFSEAEMTDDSFFLVSNNKDYSLNFKNSAIHIVTEAEAMMMVKDTTYAALVLHSLYALPPYILKDVVPQIKVIWFGWGYDMYNNYFPYKPLVPRETLKPDTRKIAVSFSFRKEKLRITEPLKRIIYGEKYANNVIKSALSRIDFFGGVFEEEYDLLKSRVAYFRAKKIIHNYIHPEEFAKPDINIIQRNDGRNILLGNSGGTTNNHIDVLKLLHRSVGGNLNGMKIICPLSYGGKSDYVNAVTKTGHDLFGDSFVPLTTFLPLAEYNQLVLSCNALLFGHIRQAATCNCLTSMWMGLKLFMYKDSMNYNHYKQEGEIIYSLEDELTLENLTTALSDEDILNCRRVIESRYSYRQWKEDLKHILNEISNK